MRKEFLKKGQWRLMLTLDSFSFYGNANHLKVRGCGGSVGMWFSSVGSSEFESGFPHSLRGRRPCLCKKKQAENKLVQLCGGSIKGIVSRKFDMLLLKPLDRYKFSTPFLFDPFFKKYHCFFISKLIVWDLIGKVKKNQMRQNLHTDKIFLSISAKYM
jgi:hypothetical protein